jgi:ketosteroid isomerase-like protein
VGENAEIVRRFYDEFERSDYDAMLARFHPDVEYDLTHGFPDGRVYHGQVGAQEAWRRWRGTWATYDVEIEEILESGGRVLALTRLHARSKGHGIETETDGADLFTLRDGRIVRFAIYLDRDEARRDAGF